MPYDWNHVWTADDPMIPLEVGQMFVAAFCERTEAYSPSDPPAYWPPPTLTKDEYFQFTDTRGFASFDVSNLQYWLEMICTQFVYHLGGGDFSGQAQIPTWAWESGEPHSIVDAALGGNGWTRIYHREFRSVTSTTYTDQTDFQNGHVARCLDDGRLYSRTAGAWVVNATAPEADRVTAYGRAKADDIIGPHVLNELRDVINLLVWVKPPFVNRQWLAGGTSNEYFGESRFAYNTWAESVTEANAQYDADGQISEGYVYGPYAAYYAWQGTPNTYWLELWRMRGKMFVETLGGGWGGGAGAVPFNRTIDFYVKAESYTTVEGAYFSNMGDPVLDGLWNRWDSQTVSAGATTATSIFLGQTTRPTFGAEPPPETLDHPGWQPKFPDGFTCIYKYDVPGGFQYVAG